MLGGRGGRQSRAGAETERKSAPGSDTDGSLSKMSDQRQRRQHLVHRPWGEEKVPKQTEKRLAVFCRGSGLEDPYNPICRDRALDPRDRDWGTA